MSRWNKDSENKMTTKSIILIFFF